MPLEKLTRTDLAALRPGAGPSPVIAEYTAFLRTLPVGDGGRATPEVEGATPLVIRKRIRAAAAASAVQVKFLRTKDDEVVFEVVDAANAPKRRGRRPKSEVVPA